MYKNVLAATAVAALMSVSFLVPAQAGGATSAASKYKAAYSTQEAQAPAAQTAIYRITEFSSSSAPSSKSSGPRR